MSGFRARPDALSMARRFPQPEEARVMDCVAAAGAHASGALSVLGAAVAEVVAERVPPTLHEAALGAVAHQIVQQVLMRRQRPGRAG